MTTLTYRYCLIKASVKLGGWGDKLIFPFLYLEIHYFFRNSALQLKEGPLIKNGPINFVHKFFPNSP
jgi:hypothetical protein